MSIEIPFSAPCERNKDDILAAISPYLNEVDVVLEIGSGTAQHAVHFGRELPRLSWQTSDQAAYLGGIRSQLLNAGLRNVQYPFELDVNQASWIKSGDRFPAVFTANTLHIMDWSSVKAFFSGLPSVTTPKAYLMVYGPFKYQGQFTSESNRSFDENLRAGDWGSAIPDFERVAELAHNIGYALLEDICMSANNQCLIFKGN